MLIVTGLSPTLTTTEQSFNLNRTVSGFITGAKVRYLLWTVLGANLMTRLLTMALLPLTDTTEARYAEIARKMLETGNWITLQHDYGVPFWAKPPLSTWLSSGSMGLFGVNQFAARLPYLFLSLAMLAMVWYLGRRRYNRDFGLLSAALLFSFPLFYVAASAVMTDAALAFSCCLCFMAFWLAISENLYWKQRLWGYAFFAGLGLGLLAKGPICLALTFPPLFIWFFRQDIGWRALWQRLPWVSGSLLMLLIAAPWYVLAELRTPGFLNYFIIGEHIQRFLVSGWSGDLYGHAHSAAIGTIWIFWIVAALPWSVLSIFWLLSWRTPRFSWLKNLLWKNDCWLSYLFWWAIWPMLFFTLARNIIWPYVITSLPAFALLVAEIWRRGIPENTLNYRRGLWLPFMLSALILMLMLAGMDQPWARQTQKFMVSEYLDRRTSESSQFYYLFDRYASAEFYSKGQAKHTDDAGILDELRANSTRDFIAIEENKLKRMPPELFSDFERVKSQFGVALFEEKLALVGVTP